MTFAATDAGIQTPNGLENKAALTIADRSRIVAPRDQIQEWGQEAGEVYIQVPNLGLKTQLDE